MNYWTSNLVAKPLTREMLDEAIAGWAKMERWAGEVPYYIVSPQEYERWKKRAEEAKK